MQNGVHIIEVSTFQGFVIERSHFTYVYFPYCIIIIILNIRIRIYNLLVYTPTYSRVVFEVSETLDLVWNWGCRGHVEIVFSEFCYKQSRTQ